MKPDDILDARLGDDIRNVLLPGEQLLWEGRPLVVKKHKLFSLSFFKDFVNALYPIIGFVLIIFIWGFRHGYLYFSIYLIDCF